MRLYEIMNYQILPKFSCWITADGSIIESPVPGVFWHDNEAKKHFPDANDALGHALRTGWVRINAGGHYYDVQFDFDAASNKALRVAIGLINAVDLDGIHYNIEDGGVNYKTFNLPSSAIRFINTKLRTKL